MQRLNHIGDHPQDLFDFALAEIRAGKDCVLVIITQIEGSSARSIGSPMIVCSDGRYAGNISSGCLDQDIAVQSLESLKLGHVRCVRYGKGSPYIDLRLPCGGGLDVLFIPHPDIKGLEHICQTLSRRKTVRTEFDGYEFLYTPKLRLIVFGQTQETDRLVHIAQTSNLDVIDNPNVSDLSADKWTAIVLLFHDHDKEIPILETALKSDAFYIGAMGSRASHASRIDALEKIGIRPSDISRIKGPIGLVPSTRDAGRLAISVLAEIFETDRQRE